MVRKKKKNKVLPLIAMLLVVVVLGAGYFVVKKMDLNAEPVEESTVFSIQSKAVDTIVSVTFNDINGEPITFDKDDGIWYYSAEKEFPVSQTAVTDMVSGMGTILGTREFAEDTGEFGFDDPQNVLSVTYSSDAGEETVKYTIGADNSFNSGTYIRDDVSGKIYLGSGNPAAAFAEKAKDDFIETDIPAADVEVTSTHTVTITGTDGEQNVITDVDGIDEFMADPFGNADCSDWVKYNCTDEDMAEYGITKGDDKASILVEYKTTVTVTDDTGTHYPRIDATYNIWFGNTLEDGSVYYTITDSKFVYKLSKEDFALAMSYLTYEPAEVSETDTVSEAPIETETVSETEAVSETTSVSETAVATETE